MDKIFGPNFTPSRKKNDCVIGFFIRKKIVNEQIGSIKDDQRTLVTKGMVWTYFYYLWCHNKLLFPFFEIKQKNKFIPGSISILQEYLISKNLNTNEYLKKDGTLKLIKKYHLINFINDMIQGSQGTLNIPFLKKNTELSPEEYLDDKLRNQSKQYEKMLNDITKTVTSPPQLTSIKLDGHNSNLISITQPKLIHSSNAIKPIKEKMKWT
jgi:hypothetical protein